MINPQIIEGQIVGGFVHGLGNALFERMSFDPEGQPLSTNYGEYLLPMASDVPHVLASGVRIDHHPVNPVDIAEWIDSPPAGDRQAAGASGPQRQIRA